MIHSLWQTIRSEALQEANNEPLLTSFLHATILNHKSLQSALSYHLANKLDCHETPALLLREVIDQALEADPEISLKVAADIRAVYERDSACEQYSTPLLYFKGFLALQSHRIAHWLWHQNRKAMALYFQHRISLVFNVDIHPAAQIGSGILIDHATGVVIGETSVVGDNVSIMQSVTLGGTGKEDGDRHPKVGDCVLISAGAKILGNINIGTGAKIGAGSVVLHDVPAHSTAVGVPAKLIGGQLNYQPALEMNHQFNDDNNS